jgi:hypothetical protein
MLKPLFGARGYRLSHELFNEVAEPFVQGLGLRRHGLQLSQLRIRSDLGKLWPDERLVAESAENVAITAGDVWRRWADEVSAVTVSCGHLIPEHAATEVVRAVLPFFEAATTRDPDFLAAGPEALPN